MKSQWEEQKFIQILLTVTKKNQTEYSNTVRLKFRCLYIPVHDKYIKTDYLSAFSMGRGVLAGGSVLGLGALCYYGLGMSSELGAMDKAV